MRIHCHSQLLVSVSRRECSRGNSFHDVPNGPEGVLWCRFRDQKGNSG
jgi:hypothetical protein